MFKKLMNAIKRSPKRTIAVVAVLGVAAAAVPIAVGAWGDSNGGRTMYTLDQINDGILGDTIVFNSISDSPVFGNERNFVSVREDTGVNAGSGNVWHESLKVEDGKTYIVRMYVHNNNPNGENAVAKNVTTTFNVPTTVGKSIEVNGFIDSTNANPVSYWDNAYFTSDSNFSLSYVPGSAKLENNGIGAGGGITLSDNLVMGGTKIGYSSLNGEIPGCYQYAGYVTIRVKATFEDDYLVEKVVRRDEDKTWSESVTAKVGDIVHFQIQYKNLSSSETTNVMVKDILPENLEYINGSTVLYNGTNPTGIARNDKITTTGVNIGGYGPNGNAYIRFSARVVDEVLECGANTLTNWGQVGVGEKTKQDSASVNVSVVCETPMCEIPGKTHLPVDDPGCKEEEEEKFCTVEGKTHLPVGDPDCKVDELPYTGPASIASTILGLGSIGTAGAYYVASRKQLK